LLEVIHFTVTDGPDERFRNYVTSTVEVGPELMGGGERLLLTFRGNDGFPFVEIQPLRMEEYWKEKVGQWFDLEYRRHN
jgi:hypothetical protein